MTRTTKRRLALGLLGSTMVMGGCVTQQDYDQLLSNNRSLTARNEQLAAELESARSTTDSLRSARQGADSMLDESNATNSELRQGLDAARQTISRMEDEMARLSLGRLDATTDRALSALAARYSDRMSYDSDRGMIRFSSDLTFSSGSDEVRSGASESIAALAEVLNSSGARPYDVMIVGHTDSAVPSAGTRQRHPSNTHLSAHRAIAVRNTLMSSGVDSARMQVAGWGPNRPVVENNADGNTPQNRRVEVFLSPSTRSASLPAPSPSGNSAPVDSAAPSTRGYDPTK